VTGAVIFDLDGTVLDNEGEWESVFRQGAENNNLQSKGAWIHEPGIGITVNWKRHFSSDPGLVDKLTRETWNLYNEMFKVQSAKLLVTNPGFGSLLSLIISRKPIYNNSPTMGCLYFH